PRFCLENTNSSIKKLDYSIRIKHIFFACFGIFILDSKIIFSVVAIFKSSTDFFLLSFQVLNKINLIWFANVICRQVEFIEDTQILWKFFIILGIPVFV